MKQKTSYYVRLLGMLLLCMATALPIWAQGTGVVGGTVIDVSGEPVIGASVLLVGTANGTITDLDGNFSLNNVPANGVLKVSFIGYKSAEIQVKNQKKLVIKLIEDAKALDEVVVVGYGVQRKSDLTGAVASVKATEALKSTPTGNVSDALQGRLAGVSIVSSGDPSKDATIRVRGVNSVSADSGPLVVIDGFIGGSLQSLNPADVQSIELLKDASATAIYGSRGANGVILVTTKTPSKDKLTVSVNAFVNLKTIVSYPDKLSPGEFADLANAYGREYNESQGKAPTVFYTDEEVKAFKEGRAGFDYLKAIFNSPAVTQNYEVSIAGGGEKTTFLTSIRYEGNNGIVESSKSDRFNWRLKVDTKIKKWLEAGANFWGDYKKTSGPRITQYNGLLATATGLPGTVMPTDEKGDYINDFTLNNVAKFYNPMGMINELDAQNEAVTNRLQGYVQFNIIEGLTFRSQLGVTFGNTLNTSSNNSRSYAGMVQPVQTSASASTKWSLGWLNTNTLNYTKEFNKNHRINATGVFEQSYDNAYALNGSGSILMYEQLGSDALSWAEKLSTSSERTITGLLSGMFRVNYVLMNRYMLTASIRADGSSRLADKWDYFPSAALAWDMKQEAFMKDVTFLEQLKLRVGYGSVGNQAVEPYRIYSKMTPQNINNVTNYKVDRPSSPFLKWERNDQINVGLDMSFFNGRLSANIDWYEKKSRDILLEVKQPIFAGWSSVLRNAGEIENKGFEITLSGDPVNNKDWSWHTDVTLSHNKGIYTKIPTWNKMQDQAGAYANGVFKMIEGEKLSSFWGYFVDGVWKTNEVNQQVTIVNSKGETKTGTYAEIYKVVPGELKFRDLNNDGEYNADDKSIIGNGQPKFSWGWNNTIRYKNFDISVFIIGVHGFDIYNINKFSGIGDVAPKPYMLNRWTKDNENTDVPGFVVGGGKAPNGYTTRNVEKGDFIKLKNITLGYNLPTSICKNLYLNSLRVYGSVQNPFHISKYSGLDPETALSSPMTSGVDWEAYPNSRNFLLGVNLSF